MLNIFDIWGFDIYIFFSFSFIDNHVPSWVAKIVIYMDNAGNFLCSCIYMIRNLMIAYLLIFLFIFFIYNYVVGTNKSKFVINSLTTEVVRIKRFLVSEAAFLFVGHTKTLVDAFFAQLAIVWIISDFFSH